MRDLERIGAMTVDAAVKGFPARAGLMRLDEIGRQGWNVLHGDLPLPLLVLKRDALKENSAWMKAFLATTGASLAPHGKTTMSPQLFARQFADGAWGMTCATVSQLQVYRMFGVQRVIFANQLIGAANTAFVLSELLRDPNFEFYALADSIAAVRLLAREAQAAGIPCPLRLLLEVGQPGARTGARTFEAAMAVAAEIDWASPWLALHGVATYEGVLGGDGDDEKEARIGACFSLLDQVARGCAKASLFAPGAEVILSAGGSQYFDIACAALNAIDLGRQTRTVLRSGCYLTHDALHYRAALERMRVRDPRLELPEGDLNPALELWAYIQSLPEPGLALATAGKRDTSFDMGLPIPEAWFRPGAGQRPHRLDGHTVSRLDDQHAYLRLPPASPLAVGDMIRMGISHPCTTLDKWQVIPIVDREYNIVNAVRTFF